MFREIYRSFLNSTIKSTVLGGLSAAYFRSLNVGTVIFTGVFAALSIRDYIKHSAFESHNDALFLKRMTSAERSAFLQGCKSAQSYIDQAKSWLPTQAAFNNPKSYYAGLLAGEMLNSKNPVDKATSENVIRYVQKRNKGPYVL